MTTAFITWASIVVLMLTLLMVRFISLAVHRQHIRKNALFGLFSEREMLFVPGDCLKNEKPDYDNTEDYDL